MPFFAILGDVRRQFRSKWLDTLETAAARRVEEATPRPAQPHAFVVDGNEVLLSTSPAVPGHSIVQFKGEVVHLRDAPPYW